MREFKKNVPPADFDLAISLTADGCSVQVQKAFGVGELPPQPFAFALDLAKLPPHSTIEDWISKAQSARRTSSRELKQAKELGQALFESVFSREVLSIFSA